MVTQAFKVEINPGLSPLVPHGRLRGFPPQLTELGDNQGNGPLGLTRGGGLFNLPRPSLGHPFHQGVVHGDALRPTEDDSACGAQGRVQETLWGDQGQNDFRGPPGRIPPRDGPEVSAPEVARRVAGEPGNVHPPL